MLIDNFSKVKILGYFSVRAGSLGKRSIQQTEKHKIEICRIYLPNRLGVTREECFDSIVMRGLIKHSLIEYLFFTWIPDKSIEE